MRLSVMLSCVVLAVCLLLQPGSAAAEIQMQRAEDGSLLLFNDRHQAKQRADQNRQKQDTAYDAEQQAKADAMAGQEAADDDTPTRTQAINEVTQEYNAKTQAINEKRKKANEDYQKKMDDLTQRKQEMERQIRLAETQDRDARKRFLFYEYTKLSREQEKINDDYQETIDKLNKQLAKTREWYDERKEQINEKYDAMGAE